MLPISTALARQAGTTLGTLHALAIPSESPINPYLISRRPEADWYQLRDRARAAGKPWAEQLDASLPALLDLHGIETEVAADRLILCNQNFIPSHVRQGRNDELIVMEWDFAGSLTAELEIGIALTHWTMRPSTNLKAVAALREGYLDVAEWPKLTWSLSGRERPGQRAYNAMRGHRPRRSGVAVPSLEREARPRLPDDAWGLEQLPRPDAR